MGTDTSANGCLPTAGNRWLLPDPSSSWKVSEEQEEDGTKRTDSGGVHRQHPHGCWTWSGASLLLEVLRPPQRTFLVRPDVSFVGVADPIDVFFFTGAT